ncbi:MAG: DUF1344 domain-containing protein [Devosia sp.]
MRKLLVPMLVVVSLGLSSMAMAADSSATGAIKALDAKACTVTLADNTVYHFGAKCDFSKLKVGDKVTVTFTKAGDTDNASKIEMAK